MRERKMNVKNVRLVKNVRDVGISGSSVFLWLEDGSRIEVYADSGKLQYLKVES